MTARAASRVEVIAHRGFSGIAPENTLAAIRAAVEAGADRVEVDVLLTRDGVPVLLHDADLDRTTNGSGPAAARTLAEVRALDAGAWFDPRFTGERVPTLSEALQFCRGRIPLNLEIKSEAVEAGEAPSGIEALVVEAIRLAGTAAEVEVSSFDPRALVRIRRLFPELGLQALYNEDLHRGLGPVEVCSQAGARAFNCSREEVLPGWIGEAHRAGLRLQVYTADEPAEIERLLEMGVDGIFTNHPDRMRRLLDRPTGDPPRS